MLQKPMVLAALRRLHRLYSETVECLNGHLDTSLELGLSAVVHGSKKHLASQLVFGITALFHDISGLDCFSR